MHCFILPEYPRCFIIKFIHALEKRGNVKKLQRQVADMPANRRKFRFQSRFHAFLTRINVNGLTRFGREVGLSCERLNLARRE